MMIFHIVIGEGIRLYGGNETDKETNREIHKSGIYDDQPKHPVFVVR